MNRELVLIFLVSLASGSIATLISDFYKQNLSIIGRSIIGYGFPLSWHGESRPVVYPEIPTVGWFSWESFALDIAFWSLIIAVLTAVVFRWLKSRILRW